MGLFDPAWKSKDSKRALKAVEKEKKQTTLAKIVQESYSIVVYEAALSKLADQSLAVIVKSNQYKSSKQIAAVKYITDLAILQNLIVSDKAVATGISDRITDLLIQDVEQKNDQNELASIAMHHDHMEVRCAALGKLSDQVYLGSIAKAFSTQPHALIIKAIHTISDQSILEEIARTKNKNRDNDVVYRMLAADKLTNRVVADETYVDVALNGYAGFGQLAHVAGKIQNELLLNDIVENTDKAIVCHAALEKLVAKKKITRKEASIRLTFFQLTHDSDSIRPKHPKYANANRSQLIDFDDTALILKLAFEVDEIFYRETYLWHNGEGYVRTEQRVARILVPKIKDDATLRKIAEESKHKHFRDMAKFCLNETPLSEALSSLDSKDSKVWG